VYSTVTPTLLGLLLMLAPRWTRERCLIACNDAARTWCSRNLSARQPARSIPQSTPFTRSLPPLTRVNEDEEKQLQNLTKKINNKKLVG